MRCEGARGESVQGKCAFDKRSECRVDACAIVARAQVLVSVGESERERRLLRGHLGRCKEARRSLFLGQGLESAGDALDELLDLDALGDGALADDIQGEFVSGGDEIGLIRRRLQRRKLLEQLFGPLRIKIGTLLAQLRRGEARQP